MLLLQKKASSQIYIRKKFKKNSKQIFALKKLNIIKKRMQIYA